MNSLTTTMATAATKPMAMTLQLPLTQPAKFQPRGIYRPNAQRLSLSLAPLVAQRSLLFRIKADLATKTTYGQLSPTCQSAEGSAAIYSATSPALFILTATTAKSARIASAAMSVFSGGALSTSSVWSQDSWKGETSPFGFQSEAESQAQAQSHEAVIARRSLTNSIAAEDNRRHAVAFSPSVNWNDMGEEETEMEMSSEKVKMFARPKPLNLEGFDSNSATKVSLSLAPAIEVTVSSAKRRDSFFRASVASFDSDFSVGVSAPSESASISVSSNDLALNFKFPAIPSKLADNSNSQAPSKLVKRNSKSGSNGASTEESIQKRVSKHSKAFGKVIGHLSMQPLKKEGHQRRQTTPFIISHLQPQQLLAVPEYSLPPLKASMSPIRMSFIASAGGAPGSIVNAHMRSFSTTLPTIPARAALPPPPPPPVPMAQAPACAAEQLPVKKQANTNPVLLPSQIQASIVHNKPSHPRPPRSVPPPPLPLSGPPGAHLPAPKGHKRYQSSPAVSNFYLKAWNVEDDVPPVPALPAMALTAAAPAAPRGRAKSMLGRSGAVRIAATAAAAAPPVPVAARI